MMNYNNQPDAEFRCRIPMPNSDAEFRCRIPMPNSEHSLNRRSQFQHPRLLRGLVFIFTLILTLTACDMNGFFADGVHHITGTPYNPDGYNVAGYNAEGFNANGYDKDGYDADGFNASGIHRDTGTPYAPDGYDKYGYTSDGYDKDGYDSTGYNRKGFNTAGIHRDTGKKYDRYGYDTDGYDEDGFNADGDHRETGTQYDPDGFNADGIHKDTGIPYDTDGYDKYGYTSDGYDKDGYTSEGYDVDGFDAEGNDRYTGEKYNRFGYDRDGFAKDGYNVLGYDRKGFKRDGYNDADVYKDDFPALAEGNTDPADIWSDGTTMWVSNSSTSNPKIYAYNMETKEHDEDKDFALSSGTNIRYTGIWSNGTTMWVMRTTGFASTDTMSIWAFKMSDKTRDSAKDISPDFNGNTYSSTLWSSDGITMWAAGTNWKRVDAYNIAGKTRDTAKEFLGEETGQTIPVANFAPCGIWSNETTMWIRDFNNNKIYAYTIANATRDTTKEFDSVVSASAGGYDNLNGGIWSNGTTMWVVSHGDDKIYAYDMATGARPPKTD